MAKQTNKDLIRLTKSVGKQIKSGKTSKKADEANALYWDAYMRDALMSADGGDYPHHVELAAQLAAYFALTLPAGRQPYANQH